MNKPSYHKWNLTVIRLFFVSHRFKVSKEKFSTWLIYCCLQETWLGGFKKDGQAVTGFATLKKELGPSFSLVESCDMPFFIRETARKNQWTVAHCTVWSRKMNWADMLDRFFLECLYVCDNMGKGGKKICSRIFMYMLFGVLVCLRKSLLF